jgi:hypothetical protein
MQSSVEVVAHVNQRETSNQTLFSSCKNATLRSNITMTKHLQVYYHAIFGALGGLLGWWAMGSLPSQTWNIWVASLVVGTGIGLCIGGFIAATDGAMIKRVSSRAIHDGIIGAIAGASAGFVGLLLAQVVWGFLEGGFFARALVWSILGLLIGIGDFAVSRQVQRATYAALGGLTGGLLGGLLYEGLTQLFLEYSGTVQVITSGIGLITVGACIGALIPLARQVFSHGELHVLKGEQTGLVREVTDSASIGRYDGNDLYLPDTGICWRHAKVYRTEGGFMLEVVAEADQPVAVGTSQVVPGQRVAIKHGDTFQIGEALVEFVVR